MFDRGKWEKRPARRKYKREWEQRRRKEDHAYREKLRARDRKRHRKFPERMLLTKARARAKQDKVACTIVLGDIIIPKTCPVLGIKLYKGSRKRHDGSPTLDRVILDQGYIPGNVAVISHRANRIKSDASLQELEALIRWLNNWRHRTHE